MGIEPLFELFGFDIKDRQGGQVNAVDAPWVEQSFCINDWVWIELHSIRHK